MRNERSELVPGVRRKHGRVEVPPLRECDSGRCSESRSQLENKRTAFKRMTESVKFRVWVNRLIYEIDNGESVESAVDRMMAPENLRIETMQNGRWVAE